MNYTMLIVTALVSGLIATLVTLIWQHIEGVKKRKYDVFTVLMSCRYSTACERIVEALNMIEVVYCKDQEVCETYRNFLAETNKPEDGKRDIEEKFLKLLEAMAKVLSLKDITWDRIKHHYYPPELEHRHNLESELLRKQVDHLSK